MANSVNKKLKNSIRKDRSAGDRYLAQLKSWARGKRTMVTIPNPNPNETNKRFIRVEGNHSSAFGPWKKTEKESKSND
jgi:hypothetical protein